MGVFDVFFLCARLSFIFLISIDFFNRLLISCFKELCVFCCVFFSSLFERSSWANLYTSVFISTNVF
ncbi:unnamed protein product [Moneuplotes crassus]|uniref:Uncharacterized protein n=1 Tax=Euplotes crassus TaxID=5936 RepID=A0AAD1U9J9_EUPCR|nr:unnamed protein product [Moneuplotes crassus]